MYYYLYTTTGHLTLSQESSSPTFLQFIFFATYLYWPTAVLVSFQFWDSETQRVDESLLDQKSTI